LSLILPSGHVCIDPRVVAFIRVKRIPGLNSDPCCQ
jgi:hypothetical protein